jgi:hypothetical protein
MLPKYSTKQLAALYESRTQKDTAYSRSCGKCYNPSVAAEGFLASDRILPSGFALRKEAVFCTIGIFELLGG